MPNKQTKKSPYKKNMYIILGESSRSRSNGVLLRQKISESKSGAGSGRVKRGFDSGGSVKPSPTPIPIPIPLSQNFIFMGNFGYI